MFIALWSVTKESSSCLEPGKYSHGMIAWYDLDSVSDTCFFCKWYETLLRKQDFSKRSNLEQNPYENRRFTLKPVLCLRFFKFFITIPWKVLFLTPRNTVVHSISKSCLKNLAKLVCDFLGCWLVALWFFFL